MRSRFQYIRPGSLKEALEFLNEHGRQTSVLAGGTDLMIAVRSGNLTSRYVLDISRLEELRSAERLNSYISVGPALTFAEIAGSPLIKELAPVLGAAARCVGSVQIRNVGTLGGNVANASPAADGLPPLVVHRARVLIQSATADRIEHVEDLITAPYRTDLRPEDLMTRFLLEPMEEGSRFSFQRIAKRRALAVARINAAAIGTVGPDGSVTDVRLAVGSVTPQPCRMIDAENHLRGRIPDEIAIRQAAQKVSQEMVRRSGIRASSEYKRPAVEGLVIRVLDEVLGGARRE